MAAIALPISQLEPIRRESEKVHADTECVVACAGKETADKATFWTIVYKTAKIAVRLSRLTAKQGRFIKDLVDRDLSRVTPAELDRMAAGLDAIMDGERQILDLSKNLGAEIRAFWSASLNLLAEQVDYLESISTSLHSAADRETSLLMGIAVQQLEANYKDEAVA
jgi:hypothetical protein